MKVIIIEDEKPASQKLIRTLSQCDEPVDVLGVLGSVQASVQWLQENGQPELIFMDIELSDGTSFQLFDKVTILCPVIFTTAYDDYWQEAFEHHGIDYLLKPIKQEKLNLALKKYDKLKQYFAANLKQLQAAQKASPAYRKRYLVKRGTDYVSIRIEDVCYLYATHKLVCMVDNKGQKFILDESLSDIEKELDPAQFFRVNRKYLINLTAIKKIKAYSRSKLQLEVEPAVNEEIIISQENVSNFKEWIGS